MIKKNERLTGDAVMAQKKAIVLLADGFEETEAVVAIDVLRRAGVFVMVAGIIGLMIKGSRGVVLMADKRFNETDTDFDAVVLPGGFQGAKNLAASKEVGAFVARLNSEKKIIAAICAAPSVVLAPLGILKGLSVTGYPGMLEGFSKETKYREDDVVVDGNIITSRGPATAISFALTVAECLVGGDIADKVKKAMLQR